MRKGRREESRRPFDFMVGARRFELPTPCTPCRCATKLRYAPTQTGNYSGITQPVLEAAVFAPVPDVFRLSKGPPEQGLPPCGPPSAASRFPDVAGSAALRARYPDDGVRR